MDKSTVKFEIERRTYDGGVLPAEYFILKNGLYIAHASTEEQALRIYEDQIAKQKCVIEIIKSSEIE